MKSYLNPQPFAVDRVSKINEKPAKPEHYRHFKDNKTAKEIYKNESEEQAWTDVLEKFNPEQKFKHD
ncbi:hypothetical protein [Legionella saoudiensis]|uniref:hypothetical protein n=1 Tax=Legionella saoudiensis TaxID=1750561 RepID=UPI00072FEC8A|nr:hypothetical protein [Legionella saoudiensis]